MQISNINLLLRMASGVEKQKKTHISHKQNFDLKLYKILKKQSRLINESGAHSSQALFCLDLKYKFLLIISF